MTVRRQHSWRKAVFAPLLCICLTVCQLSSCSGLAVRPEREPGDGLLAIQLLAQLQAEGKSPDTYKGIGRFGLKGEKSSRSARIAWAVTRSGALRLEIMGPTGQPQYTVAADGHAITFISYQPYRFQRQKTKTMDLQDLLSVSISTSEIADLLAGRIPETEYLSLHFERDPAGGEEALVLKSWWDRPVQKVYLKDGRTAFKAIEAFSFQGSLRYRVAFQKTRMINGFELPAALLIENSKGERITLTVDRFFPNAVLPEDLFSPGPA